MSNMILASFLSSTLRQVCSKRSSRKSVFLRNLFYVGLALQVQIFLALLVYYVGSVDDVG
ncbi:hypothetical protein CONLIGDRAFT_676631 [Coniochaeta ligniaria NRRL 30616]|uniref:Uncharacterized protein n=1 Tax=Coniochaeta ligniaria NRRL 30616 TaxID=1408157 RepID=A0A1J7K1Y1_9PEZI|nr:hypothetical protein CONLIGDRAFT_676631 [Coniochaeta ligniaria NRRL 30616]